MIIKFKFLIFVLISILLLNSCTQVQDQTLSDNFFLEINDYDDLNVLIDEMSDYELVFLGEATHGTQEFYEVRSEISKRLIKEHDFDFIVVEGDWNSLYELNLYVKGLSNKNSAKEVLNNFDRWPEWMWSNKVIEELAEWLKEHNQDLALEDKIGFYGKDVYGAENSLLVVEELTDLEYDCMSKFVNDFSLYAQYLSQGNSPCNDEVKEIYEKIKTNQDIKNMFNEKDHFYLKQNAFVMKNAEKHYRGMVFQNMDSWNERVFHMNLTLNKLLQEKGSKAILWAHNTHVGDASFTQMAQRNSFNIGQLAREAEKNVFILGFGTFKGQVLAGSSWGQEKQVMNIPKANQNSYEYLFESYGMNNALIMFDNENIPEEVKETNNNRAIGVVYNPATEFPGNYVPTDITKRYDAFIFIRETSALEI